MSQLEEPVLEETGQPRSSDEAPIITGMMELTPEGVREHFPKLKQVVNDYIREERLKGISTPLLYDEDEVPTVGTEGNQAGTTSSGFCCDDGTSTYRQQRVCPRILNTGNEDGGTESFSSSPYAGNDAAYVVAAGQHGRSHRLADHPSCQLVLALWSSVLVTPRPGEA
jgi:hypothetical protein